VLLERLLDTQDLEQIMWGRFVFGLGIPFFFIPLSALIMEGLEGEQITRAAGLSNFLRTLGGANYASPANSAYCQGGFKKWASQNHDTELYIERKRNNAIGQSSINANGVPLSFRSNDQTIRYTRLQQCRAGGCTAPRKKGALNSGFQSGGGSALTTTGGNRQIVVGSTIVAAYQ
jgi:hypothetical protein